MRSFLKRFVFLLLFSPFCGFAPLNSFAESELGYVIYENPPPIEVTMQLGPLKGYAEKIKSWALYTGGVGSVLTLYTEGGSRIPLSFLTNSAGKNFEEQIFSGKNIDISSCGSVAWSQLMGDKANRLVESRDLGDGIGYHKYLIKEYECGTLTASPIVDKFERDQFNIINLSNEGVTKIMLYRYRSLYL